MKFSSFEKKDQGTMESGDVKQGKKSRSVIVAIISSVVTAVVVLAVITSVFFGGKLCARQEDPDTEVFYVEISDNPGDAKVQVRKAEKVILTESAGTVGQVHHTVTLQDFKRGLQAIKDLDRSKCFIFPLHGQFEEVEKIAEGNTNPSSPQEVRFVNKTGVRDPIPMEMVPLAVGENIAAFCEDFDSHWLVDSDNTVGGLNHKNGQIAKRDTEPKVVITKEGDKTTITITFECSCNSCNCNG